MIIDNLLLVKIIILLGAICIMIFIPMFMLRKKPSSESYINTMAVFGATGIVSISLGFILNYFQIILI